MVGGKPFYAAATILKIGKTLKNMLNTNRIYEKGW